MITITTEVDVAEVKTCAERVKLEVKQLQESIGDKLACITHAKGLDKGIVAQVDADGNLRRWVYKTDYELGFELRLCFCMRGELTGLSICPLAEMIKKVLSVLKMLPNVA